MAMTGKGTARKGRERRGSERADARLSMRVEAGAAAGAPRIVTESQNISASGVYCHSSHYLAPLSKVQITIILPRTPGGEAHAQELLKCDGIVVRCDQRAADRSDTPYELACMFTSLEPGMRRRVEEFVTWRNLQALRAALAPAPRKVTAPVRVARAAGASAANAGAAKAVRPALRASSNGTARKPARATARKPARPGARTGAGRARG